MRDRHKLMKNGPAPGGNGEEWECSTCSYRIMIEWPPNSRQLVLNYGEGGAIHEAVSAGVTVEDYGSFRITEEVIGLNESDEKWLNDMGLTLET